MKHVLLLILTYAVLVLETSWSQLLPAASFRVQLLPFVLLLAFHWCKPTTAIIWAATIGLLADALTSAPLGLEMSSAILIMLLLQYLIVSPNSESKSALHTKTLSVFLVVIISVLTTFGMVYLTAVFHLLWQRQLINLPIASLLPTCICSAVAGMALWLLCRGANRSSSLTSY